MTNKESNIFLFMQLKLDFYDSFIYFRNLLSILDENGNLRQTMQAYIKHINYMAV